MTNGTARCPVCHLFAFSQLLYNSLRNPAVGRQSLVLLKAQKRFVKFAVKQRSIIESRSNIFGLDVKFFNQSIRHTPDITPAIATHNNAVAKFVFASQLTSRSPAGALIALHNFCHCLLRQFLNLRRLAWAQTDRVARHLFIGARSCEYHNATLRLRKRKQWNKQQK